MLLALQVEGRQVTSIEGLAKKGVLHPVQKAMAENGGIQCGFCTPGMVLSLKGLLDENPNPDEHEIRVAISSNLCRCTGYTKILDAAKAAGKIEEVERAIEERWADKYGKLEAQLEV